MAKKKSAKFKTIFFICFFVVGALLALYPFISDLFLDLKQKNAVSGYENVVSQMSQEEIQKQLEKAQEYNNSDQNSTNYYNALNLGDVMCVVEIDAIGVKLPVYHGTDASVLDFALGHIENSSLPVGGTSTHCVITGHTGLSRAKIFDDLDKVKIGNRFRIKVLNKTLEYEVDQIKTVLPNETDDLQKIYGQDYVTLVTCTPYGINTHRLLVRGKRVNGVTATDKEKPSETTPDVVDLSGYTTANSRNIRDYVFIGAIAVLAVALVIIIVKTSKGRKKPSTEENDEK